MDLERIWFVGDPHGDFRRAVRLASERKPAAVIFLGDLELPGPLEEVMYPMLRSKIIVRGIHGNHDADDDELWRRISDGPLASSFNLHGRLENIAGVRIAGLGGVFHSKVWLPPARPEFSSYADFNGRLIPSWWTQNERDRKVHWLSNQRLVHRATIFPDVYERLAGMEADVLVTHEAPGGYGFHPLGFDAINDLAEVLGARLGFHGHHHEARRYPVGKGGCQWTGVDMRQIVDLSGMPVE